MCVSLYVCVCIYIYNICICVSIFICMSVSFSLSLVISLFSICSRVDVTSGSFLGFHLFFHFLCSRSLFSFPASFVVSILRLFLLFFLHLLLPFHFLLLLLLALSSFTVFFFLSPRFLLSLLLPPAVLLPLFSPLFVFYCFLLCLFFSSLVLYCFLFCLFFSSSFFPPSGSLLLSFLRLFLSYRQFLPFLLLSFYRLFRSLPVHPPSLPFLLLFSFFVFSFPFRLLAIPSFASLLLVSLF